MIQIAVDIETHSHFKRKINLFYFKFEKKNRRTLSSFKNLFYYMNSAVFIVTNKKQD
jgi:hypothetical protein